MQNILSGLGDSGRAAAINILPSQKAALKALTPRPHAAIAEQSATGTKQQQKIAELDRLQLALEAFYMDLGAAAEWGLRHSPAEREALLTLIPRESGRRRPTRSHLLLRSEQPAPVTEGGVATRCVVLCRVES